MVAEHHQPLDVVGPPAVADTRHGVAETFGGDLVGVELAPPLWQAGAGGQFVVAGVAGTEMPVEVPHVLTPAEDLADEPFHCGKRSAIAPVGVLGRVNSVKRVQDA